MHIYMLCGIAGLPTIDVDDWQRNTAYRQYRATDPQIVWFWRVVRALEQAERALLLKFCTGSSHVPAGGFATLFGLNGPTRFTIARVQAHTGRAEEGEMAAASTSVPAGHRNPEYEKNLLLPTASACFNMLKLPSYNRFELLEEKLLTAVRHGAEGFAFS